MRQFTKEEYQILLEGMEQILIEYKSSINYTYEKLVNKYLNHGFCYYLNKINKKEYNIFFRNLFDHIIFDEIAYIYEHLFPTPYQSMEIDYKKGITDRINWLQQKISEIKITLNESNAQNRS